MGGSSAKSCFGIPEVMFWYVFAMSSYDAHFKEGRKVTTVKDVEAEKFIVAFAQHLKRQGRFEIPKWADYVKTAKMKELPPNDPDWLYTRAASMARKIYGGQHRRGVRRNRFAKGSGKIPRYCLQQLEEMGLVEQDENGGRQITQEGQRELDTVAVQAAEEPEEEEGG